MNKTLAIVAIAALAAIVAAALILVPRLTDGDAEETAPSAETVQGQEAVAADEAEDGETVPGPDADSRSALAAELAVAAREASAAAPLVIDELTTMTGARATGTTFEYQYRLARALTPEQAARARDAISVQIATRVCQQPDVRAMIDRGAELRYAYHGPDGGLLFTTPAIVC